ncbi:epilancin biosynthesis-related protein ElxI1 [Staphylococcus hominis]|uniref:epilancin biosynthesis-related protein ElxI1 n=1 Tax=Staphylococcus hominis TaxID=1290 RepID=UPI003D093660
MKYLTKTLDLLAGLCVVLLFSKYAILSANMMFDWNLKWYFLEDIPHLAIILFIMMFVFSIPSEMIKDKQKDNKEKRNGSVAK